MIDELTLWIVIYTWIVCGVILILVVDLELRKERLKRRWRK